MTKAKALNKLKKQKFTLLELLIVVAILAIIAGGVVSSFQNVEENAAQAQAARDIAAVDDGIQKLSAFDSQLPNNVDSLLAYDLTGITPTQDAASGDSFAVVTAATPVSIPNAIDNRDISSVADGGRDGLSEKYEARFLTTAQVENLQAAGINKVRYIDALLDDNNAATNGIAFVFGTGAAPTGDYLIDSIDIPQNYFDAPRSNTGNRGRGFAINTGGTASTIAATVQFAVWDGQTTGNDTGAEADGSGTAPTASYNNAKIGAAPDAVLVAFGLSSNCSLVGKDAKFGFSSGMPYYSNVEKNEYNNYVMLVDVNQRPAKLVAVIDSKGDFRAEEFAEYLDQKL